MLTKEKLGQAKFMHCLPVRRNVVVEDAVLDSENSVVIQEANNRTFAAQVVLKKILENL
jgi:N-succinyl-L-ornithine transcarbamylase